MIEHVNNSTIDLDESKFKCKLSLGDFYGPLDFLLELVKVNKIEIKDIFVSEVTEQFLQYMGQVSTLDVDQASEYMATAATLLEIKSKSLLPVDIINNECDESAEKLFIRQVEEYQMFKNMVAELKEQESVNRFYREPDESVGEEVEVVSEHLSLDGFMTAFNKFLAKVQAKSIVKNVSRAITKESYTVVEKIKYIRSALSECGSLNFSQLFAPTSSKNEIVTTFSAILEMLKLQIISVEQSQYLEDFLIVATSVFVTDDDVNQSLMEEELNESAK